MKVWIVSKTYVGKYAWVYGLTEEKQNIRILQGNNSFPSLRTKFCVGQVWDLSFNRPYQVTPPFVEDVLVTRQSFLEEEPDMKNMLLQRVSVLKGEPDQLFQKYLRSVMGDNAAFLSESKIPLRSMEYWMPDTALKKYKREGKSFYRYSTPAKERLFEYNGLEETISEIPEQALVHISLSDWWTPTLSAKLARESRVEKRSYIRVSGWYL